MLDSKFFDNLAKQLSSLIPPGINTMKEDLEKNFRATLQGFFSKLDLVSREEFDIQVKLLHKAQERLVILEEKIHHYENTLKKTSDE